MNDVCTPAAPAAARTAADYKSGTKPVWCPGCGDFSVLGAVTRALASLQLPPHEVAATATATRSAATTSCTPAGATWT